MLIQQRSRCDHCRHYTKPRNLNPLFQIQRYLERYEEGLRLHQKGQIAAARSIYEDILSDRLVQRAPKNAVSKKRRLNIQMSKINMVLNFIVVYLFQKEAHVFTTESSPLALLCYLVAKNYASLLHDEYMASDAQYPDVAKSAIKHYLRVCCDTI